MIPFLPSFPTGSFLWTIENFGFDIMLGLFAYAMIVYAVPWLKSKSRTFTYPSSKDGKIHSRPLHPHWFARYQYLRILALVVGLFGIFLYLTFSTGWRNPLDEEVNWYGIKAPGWLFDLAYSRANDSPDGAHLLSWWGVAAFGVAVWLKTIKWHSTLDDALGDPFQGLSALVFLGGVHELLWILPRYLAYLQYIAWNVFPFAVRDSSFVVMLALFVLTFWKYKDRIVPLSIFQWPVVAYICFLFAWYLAPGILGLGYFPVTTLTNPNFSQGPYQATIYFPFLYVNLLEVFSWMVLWVPCIIQVLRHHARIA